jgi:signal transduction histidine kinase
LYRRFRDVPDGSWLKNSKAQAESANRMKSEFLAHMSHELRTRSTVFWAARNSCKPPERPGDLETASMIHKSGQHLLTLVNSILDMARIEAGRMPMEMVEVDLAGCCVTRWSCSAPRQRARVCNWNLTTKQAAGCPERFRLDQTKLTQVVNNLMHNAVKFTEQGSIQVTAKVSAHQLQLAIRDTGCGTG